jgi:hypothetical protein
MDRVPLYGLIKPLRSYDVPGRLPEQLRREFAQAACRLPQTGLFDEPRAEANLLPLEPVQGNAGGRGLNGVFTATGHIFLGVQPSVMEKSNQHDHSALPRVRPVACDRSVV